MPTLSSLRRLIGRAPLILAPALLLLLLIGGPETREADAAPGKRALDEFFKGTVVSIEDKVVTLRYDFRDKDQAKDFEDRIVWPITRRKDQGIKWFDEQLEVVGNATARHVAEWAGEVLVKVTVTPDQTKNIGGYLSPINGANDFATFSLVETFFHAWDGSSGGTHSIIKFGNQWRERGSSDDFIGFRYVDRKPPKDPIEAGKSLDITFGLQAKKLVMTAPPRMELKGKDRGKKLKTFFLGFYAIKGRALFDNIEITGKLNDEWLRHEKLELRIETPDESVAGELDSSTQALIAALGGKSSKPARELLKIVADTGRPRAFREKVIAALCSGPKRTVKYIGDLLYAPEEEIREDAIGIVKTLMGKDWGYKPGGKEASRSKAIQKMNEELKENPSLLMD